MAVSQVAPKPSRYSLTDSVFDVLAARLHSGDIPPESTINIDALARELEVSQTPIREALARLGAMGLVQRAAHTGYRAAPLISAREMKEIFDARLAVEPALARHAAQHVTDTFLHDLQGSVERLQSRAEGHTDSTPQVSLDESRYFHDRIARQSSNLFLSNALHMITGHSQRIQLVGIAKRGDHSDVCVEHTVILRAFEMRDPEAAEAAMRRHVGAIAHRTHQGFEASVDSSCPE